MAPLWRLASDVLSDPDGDPAGAVERFLARLRADEAVPFAVARTLPDAVLTISWSSTVVNAIRLRRPADVICMRSDPGGEGARTASALSGWTSAVVLEDEDALERVPAAAVLVGADAVTPDGLVNKVKTRALAEAARARNVPAYAAVGQAKFVAVPLPLEASLEATPIELFTSVATPAGMLRPQEAAEAARLAPLSERLLPLLDDLAGFRP
jgi:translation initiation factor eIF-2B subunit delta